MQEQTQCGPRSDGGRGTGEGGSEGGMEGGSHPLGCEPRPACGFFLSITESFNLSLECLIF